jgi:uncharacterized protein
VAAVRRLGRPAYRSIYAGLLCTIDLDNDPIGTYDALLDLAPPAIDLLLPHGTWTHPPPGRIAGAPETPYADWLIAVFDRWYAAPRFETAIRVFETIIAGLVGGPSRSESMGTSPVRTITIDSDGSMEQVDALKVAYHGATATGLDVHTASFDDALRHPALVARQIGVDALSDVCQRCDVRDVCGGGYYPHRHRSGEGYRNPSVYCPDLFRLVGHIRGRVTDDVRALLPT